MRKNNLIVLEGIDGVGKSTIAQELRGLLSRKGIPVILYEKVEKKYRKFDRLKPFIKSTSIATSHLFYLSSSSYKSEIIRKLLKRHWVICDRYAYSTEAYHRAKGSKIRLPMEKLGILKPDFAFLITLDEKIRRRRLKKRGKFDKDDMVLKKVGSMPHKKEKIFKGFGLIPIDNSGSLSETMSQIGKTIFTKI